MNTYQAHLIVSKKGQIALPSALCRLLNLEPKTQLVLEWTEGGTISLKKPAQTIEQVIGSLPLKTQKSEITKERIAKAQSLHYQNKMPS